MAAKYPSNNRLHSAIRKTNSRSIASIKNTGKAMSQYSGSTGRFTTPIPKIHGFNTGKVPANY